MTVDGLVKHFPIRSGVLQRQTGTVQAVNNVSFEVNHGETLSLVGESGCGKSTVAKSIMRFHQPTAGRVLLNGTDLAGLSAREIRTLRKQVQFVFQDPYASLPARMPVGEIIAEPLEIHRIGNRRVRKERVRELLEVVGLGAEVLNRYPHQFSGGQRQRVGIARALALEPTLLILDEPVSALDVSIQAQVVNLLDRLQRELSVAYLFISHDLAVVRHLTHRVAVMYLGHIVEYGDADEVFNRPTHPYTQALLSAVPNPDPHLRGRGHRIVLHGDLPNPSDPPSGCPFRTRCWKAQERCETERPRLEQRVADSGSSACHFAEPSTHSVSSRT
nr:oligopeptide/dipeptide ABC transporter ATP-binding protein [Phytoactinopolyspora alkaliphila]